VPFVDVGDEQLQIMKLRGWHRDELRRGGSVASIYPRVSAHIGFNSPVNRSHR
jgi:hypothetical protein